MTGLEMGLSVAIAVGSVLSSATVFVLAVTLPERAERTTTADREKSKATALAAQTALHAAGQAEVATMVVALRALLVEREKQLAAAQAITTAAVAAEVERMMGPLRALLEWAFAAAHAQHALVAAPTQAGAAAQPPSPTVQTSASAQPPQTTRMAPATRAAPSGAPPAVAPPGSAEPQPPEPAQTAAGLGRPHARALPKSETPHPPPVRRAAAAPLRSATLVGVGEVVPAAPPDARDTGDSGAWVRHDRPSDVDGERTEVALRSPPDALGMRPLRAALDSSPTLLSMPAQGQPIARGAPRVEVQHAAGRGTRAAD